LKVQPHGGLCAHGLIVTPPNTSILTAATTLHQAQEFVRALQSTGYISSTGQVYRLEPSLGRFGMARKTREKSRLPSWKRHGVDRDLSDTKPHPLEAPPRETCGYYQKSRSNRNGEQKLLYLEAELGRDLTAELAHFRRVNFVGQDGYRACNIRIPKTSYSKVQVFQKFFCV
jgi:hypothetical protein